MASSYKWKICKGKTFPLREHLLCENATSRVGNSSSWRVCTPSCEGKAPSCVGTHLSWRVTHVPVKEPFMEELTFLWSIFISQWKSKFMRKCTFFLSMQLPVGEVHFPGKDRISYWKTQFPFMKQSSYVKSTLYWGRGEGGKENELPVQEFSFLWVNTSLWEHFFFWEKHTSLCRNTSLCGQNSPSCGQSYFSEGLFILLGKITFFGGET